MIKKILLVSLILLFVDCAIIAQDISPKLSVSPHTFELDFFPGETREAKIKIGNKSEVAFPMIVKVVDFTAAEKTGEMLFDESSQDPSFASRFWFKIENPNFILDAGETREVHFTIEAPENAEPGGHYATMLFVPQLPSFYFKEDQPRAIPIIGVLFLSSVKTFSLEPKIQKKIEIVEFSVPKKERLVILENLLSSIIGSVTQAAEITIAKNPPSNFTLLIKNNDIYHIKPFGKILIYNLFGKKVAETEVPQKTILPGKTRSFPIEFSPEIPEKLKWLPASISNFLVQNFFIGKYQARLVLETKSPVADALLKPSSPVILTFFSLPWKFWLGVLLLFFIFGFFTLRYRKRIKRAFGVMIKPDSK